MSESTFQAMEGEDNLLEHALIFQNKYGTSKQWVKKKLASGYDVILEVNWQGGEQIRTQYENSVTIFLLPPSKEALNKRLLHRGENNLSIKKRMNYLNTELSYYAKSDYLIINDSFDTSLEELKNILLVQRLQTKNQKKRHSTLLKKLYLSTTH